MGNQVSEVRGKIVMWDGSVQEIEQPLTVAELMLEHPEQVVVELHSAVKQKRATPLPADNKLETNKVYLMLPIKRGKPVGLSGEDTRRILLILNSALHHSKFVPWLTRLCQNTTTIVEPQRKEITKQEQESCQLFFPEIQGKGGSLLWTPLRRIILTENSLTGCSSRPFSHTYTKLLYICSLFVICFWYCCFFSWSFIPMI